MQSTNCISIPHEGKRPDQVGPDRRRSSWPTTTTRLLGCPQACQLPPPALARLREWRSVGAVGPATHTAGRGSEKTPASQDGWGLSFRSSRCGTGTSNVGLASNPPRPGHQRGLAFALPTSASDLVGQLDPSQPPEPRRWGLSLFELECARRPASHQHQRESGLAEGVA